jgi:hypothetical protein
MHQTALLITLLLIASGSNAEPLAFRPVPGLDRAQGGSALAVDASRGRLAVGDERGVWLREPDGRVSRALGSGPVHDLAFSGSGSLLAATERGLYEIGLDRRVRRHALGPGGAGRARRLSVGPLGWFVATDDGVFVGRPGGPFRALDGALPSGEVSALTWHAAGDSLYAIIGGDLYAIQLAAAAELPVVRSAVRETLSGAGGLPVDLAQDGATHEALLLRETALARRRGDAWQSERLILPPGLEPRRIASGDAGRWIAGDGGLLGTVGSGGRFERVTGAAGQAAASALLAASSGNVPALEARARRDAR